MGSTVLGISKDAWSSADPKFRDGFSIPPAGVGITWEIVGHKMGTTKDQKNPKEFLNVICEMTDEEGSTHKHWQYFDLETREGLGELRAFIEGIGRSDFDPEENDIEDLYETQFICDYKHRQYKDKTTGEEKTAGTLVWKTLMPLNWEDGQPVDAVPKKKAKKASEAPAERPRTRKVEPEPEDDGGDDEGEEAPPAGRRTRQVRAKVQEVEEEVDGEEEEEPAAPIFKPRRRGLSDKD